MKSRYIPWFAAILLFLFIPPYFMWGILSNTLVRISLTIVLCFLFLRNKQLLSSKDGVLRTLFIVTLAYYILIGLIHGQSNMNGVLARCTMFLYVAIPFASSDFSKTVYDKFTSLYAVIILLSLLSYIGAQLGIMPSIGEINVKEHNRFYTIYPLLVMDSGFDFLRFYGPFNEPGVVGTLGAVLLCVQKFNFKDWRTVVILISGIMSMSFFFFGLIAGYGLVYLLFIRKNYLLTILLTAIFSVFYYQTKDNPMIYSTLWERFEWDETENKFKGDNRKNENVDVFFDNLKTKPAFWFGSPQSEVERFWKEVEETSSYKVIILNSGAVFLILYLLFFILLARNHKTDTKAFWLFVLVLIANTYQRPDVYSVLMIFIYSYFARFELTSIVSKKEQK